MAKRRHGTRTRYVKKYVRSRGSRAGLKGAIMPIIGGVATGVVQSFIPNDMLGGFADSAAPLAVGYMLNDKTLMTIGGYQIGLKLAQGIGGGNAAGSGAGFYE